MAGDSMEINKGREKASRSMKKNKLSTAEEIAEMADRGEDVTPYMEAPTKGYAARLREKNIQRTNIDFGLEMVDQLDAIATKLNISRQAVVKMALQDYLTRFHTGEAAFKNTASK
jgi:uncharacterized protein YdbL (DUF1318 family)